MTLPMVSVLVPTFGRCPSHLWLLNEAVASFIAQTYAGPKECVVLNDCPGQTLTCNAPGVRVINHHERIRSLGMKRQFLCELAWGLVFAVLDDDDLLLPHHLSTAVAALGDRYGYWNPQRSWWLNGKVLHSDHGHGCVHNASAFTRQAWLAAGGYPDVSVIEDQVMDRRLKRAVEVAVPLADDPRLWTHIYRWGISDCHISGGGNPEADWRKRGEQRFPPGSWEIVPGYQPRTLALLGHLLSPGKPAA